MRGQLLLAEWLSMPWALLPERASIYASVLRRWAVGEAPPVAVMASVRSDAQAREARRASSSSAGAGGIAVLPLYGVITQRGNLMDDLSGPGSTSTQVFSAALRDALNDESIGSILIDIDSPGGSVYGVQELGEEIYQARGKKPVTAIANSLAASAAYWVGSQAGELYVTPGGEVGSIGVIMAHEDYSRFMEAKGITTTYITAGKYKAEGNSDEPLSAEAREFYQSRVNDYYNGFVKAVARGRSASVADVRENMGQGRCLGAEAALAAKMVDGIATFDQLVKRLRSAMRPARSNAKDARPARSALQKALNDIDLLR